MGIIFRKSIHVFSLFLALIIFGCSTSKKTSLGYENTAIVYTRFAVDTLGNVINVKVFQVDCNECSESSVEKMKTEAIKTVSAQPKWGKIATDKSGNKVETLYTLPVAFDKRKY